MFMLNRSSQLQSELNSIAGGKLAIINLQRTPKDKKADLVIHAKCDEILQQVVSRLGIPIPSYVRQDAVCVSHTVKRAKGFQPDAPSFSCTIHVRSVHGPKCPLPLVQQVDISFEVCTKCICCCLLSCGL